VEAIWVASRYERRILRIVACWPHFDPRAGRGNDNTVECGVAAEILVSVGSYDIEPDDGVRA
jgi:hypothetical protein